MDREKRIKERAHSLWETDGHPDGRHEDHWVEAGRQIDEEVEIGPGDEPNPDAMREAAREHSGTYMVPSDMEDADQREATPGTRDQP
ncbi:DUF2934 domain-containing protein [Rhizobium herbae]|jgi:hypothetical protein